MPHSALFAQKMTELAQIQAPFFQVRQHPKMAQLTPASCDFMFGNPHDMPLPGFVEVLKKWSTPTGTDYYAYFSGDEHATAVIARTLSDRMGRPYAAEDVLMTNGATGALTVALQGLVEQGDEVIYLLPPWFFYEGMIHNAGGTPVAVNIRQDNFDLDLDAIANAITERTRAIIVNSPHNPTGKIYPPATLQALGQMLQEASDRNGRPLYLISDEAYNRILFDNRDFPSPTSYYANSLLVYTYGKTLLTPGQRLGYLALSPEMTHRTELRMPLLMAKIFAGFATPNSLLMHGIEDLEELSIDLNQLQRRRDRLITALRDIGYTVHPPEGTFYLLPKSPLADDWKFFELLADQDIFCLPGTLVNLPGYFRLSLTASDEMIERSIPGFAAAFQAAQRNA